MDRVIININLNNRNIEKTKLQNRIFNLIFLDRNLKITFIDDLVHWFCMDKREFVGV